MGVSGERVPAIQTKGHRNPGPGNLEVAANDFPGFNSQRTERRIE